MLTMWNLDESRLLCLRLAGASMLVCSMSCTPTMTVGDTSVRSSRQAWQYHCVELPNARDATRQANELGAKGWELAGVASVSSGLVLCFKRP